MIGMCEYTSQFYLPPTRLSTNGMSYPAFTPSRTASPHFGRYLSPVPQRVRGWVDLGDWLKTKVLCSPEDGHPSQYQPTDSAAAGDQTHDHLNLTPDDLTTILRQSYTTTTTTTTTTRSIIVDLLL